MSYRLSTNTPPPVVIHLDSRPTNGLQQIESGKTTNYTYSLKEAIIVPENMNLLLSLYDATIPHSFYNITSNNQLINFEVDGVVVPLLITAGNYSANALRNLMKTTLQTPVSITTANIEYTRETLKFTFSYTGSATSVKILSSSTGLSLIGLVGEIVIPKSPLVAVSSTNAVDLNDSIHGLYLRQNLSTKGALDIQQGTFSNILARIPITTNSGGIIFFTPNSNTHETMVSVPMIQTIGIRLTDDKNRTIDLNGLHFQISIKVSYIHKEVLRQLQPRRNIKIDEKKTTKKKTSPLSINNGVLREKTQLSQQTK